MIEMEALSADRISVIRNGVDTTIFKPQDGRGKRLELGLADDEFVVGAVGRLAPVKGVEYLLRGAAIAVERGTPVTLLLVGDGPLRTDLEALSSTLGIRDRVRFMGMRRDLVELYAAMDAFALPSLQEGSPNALMEAMACAKPVMASPVGGVPEIVEPEVSGVLVATGEPEAWGAELVRFATDSELRARLAAGARKRIESEYDIELTVAAHVAFYKSRIEGRRR